MALTSVSSKTYFNLITGKIQVEDITDYAAQGITFPAWSVAGYLKIEYLVSGNWVSLYNNIGGATPDFTSPSSFGPIDVVDIPLSGSDPVPTQYRVTLDVLADNGSETEKSSVDTYEYTFEAPEICLSTTVSCSASTATSVDETDYTIDGATLDDLVREHTLYPPPASGLSSISANLKTLIYSGIVTTTWTAEVKSTVQYTQDDGLVILAELEGSKEFQVICDTRLSKVLCCLSTISKTYESLKCKSPVKAELYATNTVIPTWQYIVLFLAAQSAGNATKAAAAYAKMLEYSGCGDCSCTDEITQVETDSGAVGLVIVDSPDNSIEVTPEVVGTTTYYHIQVSAAIQNIINNIGSAIQVEGDNTYIEVTSAGTNPVVFTVSYIGPPIHAEQLVQKGIYLAVAGGVPYMTVTIDEINNVGPDIAALPHTVQLGNVPVGTATSTDLAQIKIADFLNVSGGTKKYIAKANIMKRNPGNPLYKLAVADVYAEIFHDDSPSATGELYVRFINSTTGFPVPDLAALGSLITGEMHLAVEIVVEP